jgi:steroid delta-isomerase-like uncharacterized protein
MDRQPCTTAHSRRAALLAGLGVGLGLGRPWAGAAQSATPAALPPPVARFVAAMDAADPGQLAASYAPDGMLDEIGFGQTFTGRDAIRADEASFLAGFQDVTIRVTDAFAADDQGAVEWTFAGTYSGQLPGMPAGQGQVVRFRGASLLQFTADGITQHRQYFDAYTILVQLGALPAPGGGSQATPAASPAAATLGRATIDIRNFTFSPAQLVIPAGITVGWINHDSVPHTVTAADRSWDSGTLAAGQHWSHSFAQPGVVSYLCLFHPSMTGTIQVQ